MVVFRSPSEVPEHRYPDSRRLRLFDIGTLCFDMYTALLVRVAFMPSAEDDS